MIGSTKAGICSMSDATQEVKKNLAAGTPPNIDKVGRFTRRVLANAVQPLPATHRPMAYKFMI